MRGLKSIVSMAREVRASLRAASDAFNGTGHKLCLTRLLAVQSELLGATVASLRLDLRATQLEREVQRLRLENSRLQEALVRADVPCLRPHSFFGARPEKVGQ